MMSLPDAAAYAAQTHPDTPLLADGPWVAAAKDVTTMGEFAEFAAEFAGRLWAAGVRPGGYVAIVKRNHIDLQALACAVMQIGAVPVLLSVKLDVPDLLTCLDRLGQPVLLIDDAGEARLRPVADRVATLTAAVHRIDAMPAGDASAAPARAAGDTEMAIVTHTSSTTGVPKLVAHSNGSLYAHVAPTLAVAKTRGLDGMGMRSISFAHTRASSALLGNLILGVPLFAAADPDPAHIRDVLLRYRPAGLEAHPNLFLLWEDLAADPERPFGSVNRYVSTFDAIHPRTLRVLLNASDQASVAHLQGYGQTETGPVTLRVMTRDTMHSMPPRNVGLPLPDVSEVRVADGRIQARTKGLSLGYVGVDAAPPDRSAWWDMQDVGRINDAGELELLDRVADQVDGYGSLLELEDALLTALPWLSEVVLVQAPPGALTAVVCVRDGGSFEEQGWKAAAGELGLHGAAVRQYRWDDLPYTGSWKVRRHVLARQLQATS
jgi:acyl-coenzyme A synthetase/AMP-(fatty) acid ligase